LLPPLAALLCCGCQTGKPSLYARLQDDKPSVRVGGIIEAARLKDEKSLAYLVDRLTDSETSVRFYAIKSLEKLTGQTMGYRHYEPPEQREKAVARWRQWLISRTRPVADAGQRPASVQQDIKGREHE
jgi:hypothetical protein